MANFDAAWIAEDASDALDLTKNGLQEMGLAEDGDLTCWAIFGPVET